VLVRAFWEQGKINEAVEAVNDMEQRGVVGAASVYYELACCLCNNGRWRDAMLQVYNYYTTHSFIRLCFMPLFSLRAIIFSPYTN
jgi:hypothetical protein